MIIKLMHVSSVLINALLVKALINAICVRMTGNPLLNVLALLISTKKQIQKYALNAQNFAQLVQDLLKIALPVKVIG